MSINIHSLVFMQMSESMYVLEEVYEKKEERKKRKERQNDKKYVLVYNASGILRLVKNSHKSQYLKANIP